MSLSVERLSVRLRLDATELIGALTALSTEVADRPPEILHRALRVSDSPCESVVFDVDPSAAAAGVVTIRLQPSDRLRGLVAAAGARDFDGLLVEKTGHGDRAIGAEP